MPVSNQDKGMWGDSFGALNTLFGALGFCVLTATLVLQLMQNYKLANDQHRQRFDSSYFELLKLLREARDEVRYIISAEYMVLGNKSSREEALGLAAFRIAWGEAKFYIENQNPAADGKRAGEIYYSKVHKRFESNFSPYYRLIYTILRRINEDPFLNKIEKASYGNLLRTQLTSYELALIALNGLSTVSNDMSDYIIKYHLLKYTPENTSRRRILKKYYASEAFEGRD